jgi:hypothetical protein
MHRTARCLVLSLITVLVLPAVAAAQGEEKPATGYVYSTYFECEVSRQWRADEIMKSLIAPAYDAAVEKGQLASWGWLAHHTGGKWRRVLYYSAPTVEALLAAQEAIDAATGQANPDADREFGSICGAHEDYIWQVGTSSRGMGLIPVDRGEVGFSVYLECEMGEEERADEIVATVFAPIYNRHVADGTLASWGWLKHHVGGEWRRLLTMTGTDHASLLAARDAIIDEMVGKHEAVTKEYDDICDSHQDYMWNIVHETP